MTIFENFWEFLRIWQFLTILTVFENCWQVLKILKIVKIVDNIYNFWQFWQIFGEKNKDLQKIDFRVLGHGHFRKTPLPKKTKSTIMFSMWWHFKKMPPPNLTKSKFFEDAVKCKFASIQLLHEKLHPDGESNLHSVGWSPQRSSQWPHNSMERWLPHRESALTS